MTRLMSLLERSATIRGFAIVFGLYLIVFGVIQVTLSKLITITNGIGILDFEFGYTKQKALEFLGSYGAEGMVLYQNIQLLDILNPAIYSWFFAMMLFLLLRETRLAWTVVLPLLVGAFDYAENAVLFLMARNYPDISEITVSISSGLGITKYLLMIASMAAIFIGIVFWVWSRNLAQKEKIGEKN